MKVFSDLYQYQTAQEPILAIEDRTSDHVFPMLEAPTWYSRAVIVANCNELTITKTVSELVLSQPKPTSYEKTNIKERTFTQFSAPKERVAVINDFDEPKKAENVSHFVFSQPEPISLEKTKEKTSTHCSAPKDRAVDTRSTGSKLVDLATNIYALIIKVLFRNFFFTAHTTKESLTSDTTNSHEKVSQKPSFAKKPTPKEAVRNAVPNAASKTAGPAPKGAPASDTTNSHEKVSQKPSFAKKPTPKEAVRNAVPNAASKTAGPAPKGAPACDTTNSHEKAHQKPSFDEKPPKAARDTMPKVASKTAAFDPKRVPASNTTNSNQKASQTPFFAKMPPKTAERNAAPKVTFKAVAHPYMRAPVSIDKLASAPQDVRENASYKNNEAFKRLVTLYTRLNGKRKEGSTQASAQEQLKMVFKVDSYKKVKKEYKKLCLFIHPDKATQMGLKEESQGYLSKLFAFTNDYYSLAG